MRDRVNRRGIIQLYHFLKLDAKTSLDLSMHKTAWVQDDEIEWANCAVLETMENNVWIQCNGIKKAETCIHQTISEPVALLDISGGG